MINVSNDRVTITLKNGTAAASVLGQLVQIGATSETYIKAVSSPATNKVVGIVGAAGIPIGSEVPIIIKGKAQVLMEDGVTRGRKASVATSGADGYAVDTYVAGGTTKSQGIGTILESIVEGGLAWCEVAISNSADVPTAE